MKNVAPLLIRTQRFLLREYLITDEVDFIQYQTDPEFALKYSAEERGEDHARSVFRKFMAWQDDNPRQNYQFAVCHFADDNRLIGSGGIRRDSHATNEADFGVELARPFWGRHSAIISWAFSELRLHALTANTSLTDHVAARLAERAGFEPTFANDKQFWRLKQIRWPNYQGQNV